VRRQRRALARGAVQDDARVAIGRGALDAYLKAKNLTKKINFFY
jgi:hypothetical protein